jgi:hypothetical protein
MLISEPPPGKELMMRDRILISQSPSGSLNSFGETACCEASLHQPEPSNAESQDADEPASSMLKSQPPPDREMRFGETRYCYPFST